jgi:transposase-like protein
MDEKVRCPYCGRDDVVKRGFRRLKSGKKAVYFCKGCYHKFSLGLERRRFSVGVILSAVCAYNQGYSYAEVSDITYRKYKASVHRSTVSRWVQEYDLGYSGIRSAVSKRQKYPYIVGRVFKHSGLMYDFKYHRGKLNFYGKFLGLKKFISNLSRGVDEKYFTAENDRCSEIRNEVSSNIKVFENTKLNKIVGCILKAVKNNKQRHSIIESLMLSCDRDTVAVEVPVWYWDKRQNVGVCGHIDVLQVKFGKVWVLDYKPGADKENVDKVASQLFSYALGLSFRTGISLKYIMCGWFDENRLYTFNADQIISRRQSLGNATAEASKM